MRIYRLEHIKANRTKIIETIEKMFWVAILPLVPATPLVLLWVFVFRQYHLQFLYEADITVATSAWIPTFGTLYSLLVAIIFNSVWNKYQKIRTAVKQHDFDTFAVLRDEHLSPLVHLLMFMLSMIMLIAFMNFEYANVWTGSFVIGSMAYLLSLIYFTVWEIDTPHQGFWFIKTVPNKWLEVDTKAWRTWKNREKYEAWIADREKMLRETQNPKTTIKK